MKELTVFTHEQFGAIRAVKVDNEVYFVGKDLVEILGCNLTGKHVASEYIKYHCDEEDYVLVDKIHPSNGIEFDYKELGQRGGWLVNSNGAISLIQKTKSKSIEYKTDLKNWLISENLISDGIILESRKEIEFLTALEDALKPFNIKGVRQYHIESMGNTYRIDYYIPSLNIAIEYDENNHNHYTYEQHEGRQKEIEEEIGCRFIRVSDEETHFYNVGYVIKEMFKIN